MNCYFKIITISPKEAERINNYLEHEPKNVSECLSEDKVIDYSTTFSNGYTMAIQCCGVQFEEGAPENGSTNKAWTQAVLFNENGREEACSEVSDTFVGDWELIGNDDNKYIVSVSIAD